jgi:hypothetical protein
MVPHFQKTVSNMTAYYSIAINSACIEIYIVKIERSTIVMSIVVGSRLEADLGRGSNSPWKHILDDFETQL